MQDVQIQHREAEFFRKSLLAWFKQNARSFPWRETDDPFHVLVAEVMLQQTFAAKVVAVYDEFTRRYPTPERAARGNLKKMQDIIYPLGLVSRAGTLKELSKKLVSDFKGEVPSSDAELRSLPGVGQYISAAVMSISFDQHAPVVDANVNRIILRVFYGDDELAKASLKRRDIFSLAEALAPPGSTRCHNLGLLDFGALVCRHYNPSCVTCPLERICRHTWAPGRNIMGLQ